jgi:hypothetical protein
MASMRTRRLRSLEGRQVVVALSDGTHLDRCSLVASARDHVDRLWLTRDGEDLVVPLWDVVDIWEAGAGPHRAA